MKIFHLSAECYPVAKVGGLGDVVGALPKYLNQAGHHASVVMPFYDRKFTRENEFDIVFEASSRLGNHRYEFQVLKEKTNKLGFELFLIKVPGLIDREEIYSYPDETEQFVFFQLAFLDWLNWSQQTADVIHCHDHHAGLISFLLQHSALYRRISKIPTVLTIHNGQYHGAFGWDKFYYLPEIDATKTGLLDWRGGINPLAAAVKCAWKYTAVSPSYLRELTIQSNGLEYLFYLEQAKGQGIINGIDTQVWDPETDPMLPANYGIENAEDGKQANKELLCERFGLSPDKPLFTFIGRLVVEKGADLLPSIIRHSLNDHPGEINFLVLGSGDRPVEQQLTELKNQFAGRFNSFIGYDEGLAHQVYAGADFILMPSRVEPCGLNQLYALRYGTLPIVRSTGGLKDTVIDFESDLGYGITFNNNTIDEACYAIWRALTLYQNTELLQLLRKRMMELDFSWDKSANDYIKLYESLKI
ncbi:glycogen synthase [Mucilaginibacter paludis]|uniref:Glycogen synthase n=1 Tax=Mucilaginibacter paludis DSM 18603 TaxID=714943 RepID=H1Y088_9SPHI|nr:glycogen synthase [Mucilaginibacter paludis]EHQ27997.1 Glycogen synthase [Mucilaginibacter paludis DSM 18603]